MKIDMLGLTVANIPKSLSFYRWLGWKIPEPSEGQPYVEISLESGFRVSWNSVEMMRKIDEGWVEPVGHRMGMAFLCDSAADVDARYKQITAAGYRGAKAPWDAFWGQRYAQVEDPDGNLVDLFHPLER